MMKTIIISVAVLISTAALAQKGPTVESLQADCNVAEGQLAINLGQAQKTVLQLKEKIAEMQAEIDAAKPKATTTPTPTPTESFK